MSRTRDLGKVVSGNVNLPSAAVDSDFTVDTSTLVVDATNNRVGVGTASPISIMDVVSSGPAYQRIRSTSSSDTAVTLYQNADTGTTNTDGLYVGINPSEEAFVWNFEEKPLSFGTNNLYRMTINSSGQITTPYQPMFCGRQYLSDGSIITTNYRAFRWSTIELNQGNHFNNVTGIFTTPVAGNYEMRFHFNRRASNNWHAAYIFVNGTARAGSWFPPGPDANYTYAPLTVGLILSLSASDQIAFCYEDRYSAPSSDITGNTATVALIG